MPVRGHRFLLNPPGSQSTASIVAEIEDTRRWLTGRYRHGTPLDWDNETAWHLSPDVMLRISDCDRAITFAIEWDSAAKRRAARHKLDRMIEALVAFRAALEEEQRLYVLRLRAAGLAGPAKAATETTAPTTRR